MAIAPDGELLEGWHLIAGRDTVDCWKASNAPVYCFSLHSGVIRVPNAPVLGSKAAFWGKNGIRNSTPAAQGTCNASGEGMLPSFNPMRPPMGHAHLWGDASPPPQVRRSLPLCRLLAGAVGFSGRRRPFADKIAYGLDFYPNGRKIQRFYVSLQVVKTPATRMKKGFVIIPAKCVAVLLLTVWAVLMLFSLSPIYRFEEPKPFSGPDIFNPYASLQRDSALKKANFHTHTKVKGLLNECPLWPADVLEDYRALGYDILTFSNHNEITTHPTDSSLQVNVYEHGYNLCKYHKLVFGAEKVWRFDHLLPLLSSQKQYQLDRLGKGCDFIQMNHPARTLHTTIDDMRRLTGYRIIELDSGVTTENEYWDLALGAGHYSFGLANDDCHNSRALDRIAVRCNFLQCPSGKYEDIKDCLLGGCHYCMRIPSCEEGGWEEKLQLNACLPALADVRLRDSVITMRFSRPFQEAEAIGQGHTIKERYAECDSLNFTLGSKEPYVRFTVHFPDGCVLYTNPFARYDASLQESPYRNAPHPVNWPLTILFNLTLLALASGAVTAIIKLTRKKK